jgi:hypothetical protein
MPPFSPRGFPADVFLLPSCRERDPGKRTLLRIVSVLSPFPSLSRKKEKRKGTPRGQRRKNVGRNDNFLLFAHASPFALHQSHAPGRRLKARRRAAGAKGGKGACPSEAKGNLPFRPPPEPAAAGKKTGGHCRDGKYGERKVMHCGGKTYGENAFTHWQSSFFPISSAARLLLSSVPARCLFFHKPGNDFCSPAGSDTHL